ncbi:uncharacterized protein B0I36DRAFT_332219 [Microdochium trichocladiopsis]|uniref:Uncharacterized protein n=1 Tax=Microdochium trichocladiopsis TaxID=1682393 RepID=A0A9P8XY21_9PEZI|nr:uncharacterized protein B0I36DRAFT_332219 [Microdochium trichocladiopsis]KAH7024916.1 hypothetical protein B0I36DRAFT_332219 [Microdochium trichocladiopsis]
MLGDSAGGQAISLLMTALVCIHRRGSYGLILSRLCSSLLPASMPASNPAHLADVADLVAAKAAQLSFGNLLAEQTHRILSVYDQLGMRPPAELLDLPSTESTQQLFECLSQLREDKHIVRISGSVGIIYVVTLILFMFPYSAMVAVQSIIIHDNERRPIIIQITAEGPTKVQVETKLSLDSVISDALITKETRTAIRQRCTYLWDGWVEQALRVELGRYGLILRDEFLQAFCDFIVQITQHLQLSGHSPLQPAKSQKNFKELLGWNYQRRILETCKRTCQCTPAVNTIDRVKSWRHFSSIFAYTLAPIQCTCDYCGPSIKDWTRVSRRCTAHVLSRRIGSIFSNSIMCCLLEPQGSVSVSMDMNRGGCTIDGSHILRTIRSLGGEISAEEIGDRASPQIAYPAFLSLISPRAYGNGDVLGASSQGSSIYPVVLETLEVASNTAFTFVLREGVFIHDGKYYEQLGPAKESGALHAMTVPQEHFLAPITLSALQQPLPLTVSLRAGFNEILLSFNAQASGWYFFVDAYEAVQALMYLDTSWHCPHDVDSPLPSILEQDVAIRKVGMSPLLDKINVYTTHGDRRAQFLAGGFVRYKDGCLLRTGCLTCSVHKAQQLGYRSVIV